MWIFIFSLFPCVFFLCTFKWSNRYKSKIYIWNKKQFILYGTIHIWIIFQVKVLPNESVTFTFLTTYVRYSLFVSLCRPLGSHQQRPTGYSSFWGCLYIKECRDAKWFGTLMHLKIFHWTIKIKSFMWQFFKNSYDVSHHP